MQLFNPKKPFNQQFDIIIEPTIGKGEEQMPDGTIRKWESFGGKTKAIQGKAHSAQERQLCFKIFKFKTSLETTEEKMSFLKTVAKVHIDFHFAYNNPASQRKEFFYDGSEILMILLAADSDWAEAEDWEHYRNLMQKRGEE